MSPVARIVRLFALVIWIGGIIFFAFVVAPVAFLTLPSAHMAGTIVAGSLNALDQIGLICAGILLLCSGVLWCSGSSRRLLTVEIALILLMGIATALIHWDIVPRMERDRIAAGGDVDAAPVDNPARLDFERLHPISEKLEGAALFLGLGLIVAVGLERTIPSKPC